MTKHISLSSSDKNFLKMVSEATFINPFTKERQELDKKVAGAESFTSWDELLEQSMANISKILNTLKTSGKGNPASYADEDCELLQTAFLFDTYHNFRTLFDELILKQIKHGDNSITVPFARELLSQISSIGFTAEQSMRFMEIFFQMRRAFYFIESRLTGESSSVQALRSSLWNNIFTSNISWYENHLWNKMEDFSTLILGETGTGKGAAAAAIGQSGFIPFDDKKGRFTESFTRSFVSINLSQYPEALLESELFGHKKGAFTGAIENHEGILSRCSANGSIFLDEIGDVSLQVQIKLLQILQERFFSPVGSHEKLRFNGRVIAATNRPLGDLRAKGEFRNDFYYRLCSDTIVVPPLRQRIHEEPGELASLIAIILQRMTGDASPRYVNLVLDAVTKDLGSNYLWPGNVRELEQAVRSIIITRHYHGDKSFTSNSGENGILSDIRDGALDAKTLLGWYCDMLYGKHGTYEEVANITGLDRRTVKKHISEFSLSKEL